MTDSTRPSLMGDECYCERCNGWSRKASRTKCRHCYDTIQRNFPDSVRWRDVEHEAATCDVNLWHEPMPVVEKGSQLPGTDGPSSAAAPSDRGHSDHA